MRIVHVHTDDGITQTLTFVLNDADSTFRGEVVQEGTPTRWRVYPVRPMPSHQGKRWRYMVNQDNPKDWRFVPESNWHQYPDPVEGTAVDGPETAGATDSGSAADVKESVETFDGTYVHHAEGDVYLLRHVTKMFGLKITTWHIITVLDRALGTVCIRESTDGDLARTRPVGPGNIK